MTALFTEDEIVSAARSLLDKAPDGTVPGVYARKIIERAIVRRRPLITDDTTVTLGELKKLNLNMAGVRVEELVMEVVSKREPEYVAGGVYRTADGQYVKRWAGGWLIHDAAKDVTDSAQLQFPLTEAP